MTDERPLHVGVAEALGWSLIEPMNSMNLADPGMGYPPKGALVGRKEAVPRYDTDWSATGPLIERLKIRVGPVRFDGPTWEAVAHGRWVNAFTPLEAVCHVILSLHETGALADLLKGSEE